jgi:sulfite exporter TauE/SafE
VLSAIVAALALGFFGSLHCVAMCGPLCVAAARPLPYLAGRWASYALAGALFGSIGARAARLGPLQQVLAVAVAGLLFAKGLSLWLPRRDLVRLRTRPPGWLAALRPRRPLALGAITGALPCGLLAGAWALAASTSRVLDGALVMSAFAAATAPALVSGGLVLRRIGGRWAPAWHGALYCALAIWIGLRPFLVGGHACH